jgi:F-type H+-transporting ATPase subunit delta
LSAAIAQRYAAALADVALEQKCADRVKLGLAAFADAFFASTDLRIFLESPAVNREIKQKVIEKLAERMEWDPAVRNFACLIVDHRRTHMIREIQDAFQQELNLRLGIAEAEVTSARALTPSEKGELTTALERRTGKKIEAHFREDKDLLGGAMVRVGSTIYDGSVREQLARLRAQLETE